MSGLKGHHIDFGEGGLEKNVERLAVPKGIIQGSASIA
jgi:hypothetical protein